MPSIFSSTGQSNGHRVIRTFNENSIYSVVEPERLLASIHRKKIPQEIKEITELPDEYFDILYRDLIESFAAFVQILPVNNEARLFSLLDEGLLRALFALQVQQKSSKEEVDPLMSYVLFSACLLFDIACVIENRTIAISEQGGSFIRVWEPFREGSLPISGYYRIRQGGGLTPWSCRRSVVSLAVKLMPREGFNWLFKSPHALNMWIALLSEDKEGAGVLSFYIDRVREMLEEFKSTAEYFVQTNIEEFEPTDTKEADLFLAWFLEELEKGRMQLYQVTDEKILITQDAIDRYAAIKDVSKDKVLAAFEKTGFIRSKLETFYYGSGRQRVIQASDTKQQSLGTAHSLFSAGREAQQQMEKPAERVVERPVTDRVISPEDQVRATGGVGPGGVLLGYTVSTNQGFIPPAYLYNSAISLVSSTSLADRLPPLDTGKTTADVLQQPSQVNVGATVTK